MRQITMPEFWKGRDVEYASELTREIRENGEETVARANKLLEAFGEYRGVNSGWRPRAVNSRVPGAASKSTHMDGRAADLDDDDGSLDEFCMNNLDVLDEIGLWLEHPSATPRWCHVQTTPPRSGKRVFYP